MKARPPETERTPDDAGYAVGTDQNTRAKFGVRSPDVPSRAIACNRTHGLCLEQLDPALDRDSGQCRIEFDAPDDASNALTPNFPALAGRAESDARNLHRGHVYEDPDRSEQAIGTRADGARADLVAWILGLLEHHDASSTPLVGVCEEECRRESGGPSADDENVYDVLQGA
jgi:hypothetical protein